jgi:CRP-like cAMP-binding protein
MQADLAERLDRMQALPLFTGLRREDLATALGMMSWRVVAPHDEILRAGEESGDIFLIVAGQYDVIVGEGARRLVVGKARPGDLVGETAIYHQAVLRTASVVARTPGALLGLDTTVLDRLAGQGNPVPQRVEERILRDLPARIHTSFLLLDQVRREQEAEAPRTEGSLTSSVVGRVRELFRK